MEAIGVALAVLPLLLNQLDNYVQGLESIKGFRAKRYRRELEGYFTSLGAQQTIFVNHLLRALGGVEYGDEILDLSHNGLGALWMEQFMQSSLKNKSGEASIQIKNFRDILSKSIYSDIFTRIKAANKTLGTLLEQTDYQNTLRKRRTSKAPFMRQKKVHRSARSLHNAIICGKFWKCSCKDRHLVHFVFIPPYVGNLDQQDQNHKDARFRLFLRQIPLSAFLK
ncbi:unnamed protein product [Penicillium nalgiovense]|nr:unnamed protein product [Penicillium nalgiovense]